MIAVALAEIILRAEAKASPDGRAAALSKKTQKGLRRLRDGVSDLPSDFDN